ncbi:MAG: DUF2807 domain-containing protein, partial [Candidatus Omnitrophica bacterium]|nr:DUF2807 domain-containing protein [Candidatus Omnitrophota bacterium]
MFTLRLWMLSAGLICIGMLATTGCGKDPAASGLRHGDGSVAGSNVLTTRIVDVHTFEGVKIDDHFDITIAQGSAPRVIITADDNIARLLKPRIKDNILHVEVEQG